MVEPTRFQVRSGPHDRQHCPVRVKLDQARSQALTLLHEESGRMQPCQVEVRPDGTPWLLWIIGHLDAGSTATYRVVEAGPTPRRISDTVRFVDLDTDRIGVRSGRNWLATLRLNPSESHAGWSWAPAEPEKLAGCLPQGAGRGLWLGHGSVSGVNHFQAEPQAVRARPVTVETREDGIVAGRLVLRAHWETSEKLLLEEWTSWTVYPTSGALRLADLDVWLRASAGPVVFGAVGPSALPGLRLDDALGVGEDVHWRNAAGGIGAAEIDGWRSDWVSVCAARAEMTIALLAHPISFGAPPVWRLDADGLLRADPFDPGPWAPRGSVGDRRLAVGAELEVHTRLVVYTGDLRKARPSERFADYAYPPVVTPLPDA